MVTIYRRFYVYSFHWYRFISDFYYVEHWAFPEKSPYPLNFEKKYWKIPGSGESFDGIPGGYSF